MEGQTYDKKSISSELAKKMVEAAEKKANEIGVPMVIAIVDESGNLKSLSRMDGAPLLSIQLAQDKAYTAVAFGIATEDWYPIIKDDPALLTGIPKISRLIVFPGGYPINVDGAMVGGIGVSGGRDDQDFKCAKAALDILK